ncbi:MAG: retropepsin-like domain-containing protein [Alphaproteobacteria bacterium]|nr:retropepsin-like domain-containing protein [Alphaproteobacteria bacterium]
MNIRSIETGLCFLLLAPFALGAPAAADGCKPLQRYTQVQLRRSDDGNQAFVPVKMDGQDKLLLLDTGGFFSEVTPQAVKTLKLHTKQSAGVELYNVSAEHSRDAATVPSFDLGRLHWDSIDFWISPGPDTLFGSSDTRVAGILAPNLLKAYDVDIDFGNNTFGLMSPDHCEGRVIYWQASAVAVVPIQLNSDWHIIVPVTLDGITLNAMINTGANQTTLMTQKAESAFGVTLGSADTPQIGTMPDKPTEPVYHHRFRLLSFNGIAVSNPQIDLLPDLDRPVRDTGPAMGRLFAAQDAREFPDMMIGMDILKHFHLYIAYKERKLYITPASASAAAAPTAAAPATAAPAAH